MFIVFEGGDGSGKTTQSKALAERLSRDPALRGREVVHTREPGGTPGAEEIRALLMTGDAGKWSPETEILLFNAARRDHVEKVIRPAIERGAIVICDRFVGSTIAYQGARADDLAKRARRVHDVMIGLDPDLTILLDRPRGVAEASVDVRGKDRMEEVQAAFMARTRREFARMMRQDQSWVGIFAGDKATIESTITRVVKSRLGLAEAAPARVILDEEYLLSLRDLEEVPHQDKPDLFSNGKRRLTLGFGRGADANPYDMCLSITAGADGVAEGMSFRVSGIEAAFASLDVDEAEARMWERVESDMPDLMARLNGLPTEDEALGPDYQN